MGKWHKFVRGRLVEARVGDEIISVEVPHYVDIRIAWGAVAREVKRRIEVRGQEDSSPKDPEVQKRLPGLE